LLTIDCQSQSYVTIDGQSAKSVLVSIPIWGPRPDFCYCHTVTSLLMWDAFSDEREHTINYNKIRFVPQRKHLRLRYKAQPVNAVWRNNHCLLWEPYGTHRYTPWPVCRVVVR
jgi:hypothetical protein